jgi:hypothetical protein
MNLLFKSPFLIQVAELKDILQAEGIHCTILNEDSYSMRPEGLMISQDIPMLCVLNENDLPRAIQIKTEWQASHDAKLE